MNNTNQKVDLSNLSESMFIPLISRAYASKKKHPLFYDDVAINVIQHLDYDFNKYKSKLPIWGCCARTTIIDKEVKKYIDKHPYACIINLACGLDNRFKRVDNKKITWLNIDFENIINLRKQFIEKNSRVQDIACSALDEIWIDKVANNEEVLIIAEGFLMYLDEREIQQLFSMIAKRFKNVTLVVEILSYWLLKHQNIHEAVKKLDISFKWGLKNCKDFSSICPQYSYVGEENLTNAMKYYSPVFITLISPFLRKINNTIAIYKKINN